MKKVLLGVVIGALITAILFVKFMPRPGPLKVIQDPTETEKQKSITVNENKQTSVTSRVPVTPGNVDAGKGNVLTLNIGDKYFVPAEVEIKTIYQDSSGNKIEDGLHKITGETAVTVGKGCLDITTHFQDSTEISIAIPDPVKKIWHVGLYAGATEDGLGFGGFIQRDFKLTMIKKVDLLGFGRVEVDRHPKLLVGVEGNF